MSASDNVLRVWQRTHFENAMLEKWSLVKEIERLGISKSFSAAFVGARAFKSSAVSKHQPYQSGPFTIEFLAPF